jgi:quinate dehydrogenase (quinone)
MTDRLEIEDGSLSVRSAPRRLGRFFAVVFGSAVLLTGLALFVGGARLISLGGSRYYALAGLGLIVSGALLVFRRIEGAWIYLLIFAVTIPWAYWEVGLDFWQLVPRIVAPTVYAITVSVLISTRVVGNLNFAARVTSYALAALLLVGIICGTIYAITPHYIIAPPTIFSAPMAKSSNTRIDVDAWQYYGRTSKGTRFAPFDQINKDNVRQLKVAWIFRTGDPAINDAEDQNTPIQIGDTIYVCTPRNIVFALNAETGEQRWKYDPKVRSPLWHRCRGVGYFDGHATKASITPTIIQDGSECVQRIILSTTDARLIALDATTGILCTDFGHAGTIDLRVDMGEVKPGFYFQTSAPTVVRDLIVVGGWVWDNVEVGEPSGVVRAFSVHTGELIWAWDLDDPNNSGHPPPGKTFSRATPNMWSTPSFDDELGLIYLPTGNSTPDFWGAHRSSNSEKYSSSIVALDIATGR